MKIVGKGLDVSYANPNVDLTKATQKGFKFVLIRLGVHDHIDTLFEQHYRNARKTTIKVGVYWWIKAKNVADAREEARTALRLIDHKKLDLPLYVDFEDDVYFHPDMGSRKNTDVITAFCEVIKESEYTAGVYISASILAQYVVYTEIINKYSVWLAHWTGEGKLSQYDFKQTIQQFGLTTWEGTIKVDGDYMVDRGENVKEKKPLYTIAQEVIAGSWGNGENRKKKIEAAGYDYSKVQAAVNNLLSRQVREIFVKNLLPEDYETLLTILRDMGYCVVS